MQVDEIVQSKNVDDYSIDAWTMQVELHRFTYTWILFSKYLYSFLSMFGRPQMERAKFTH